MTSPIGRPRATPAKVGASAREDVLAAAARLFATGGFAGTSTRQIADAAGLRQATIYYHFANKEDILLELLLGSVTPTIERARELVDLPDPVEALDRLVRADVETLLDDPHNIGILYLSPEVAAQPFDPFREAREELTQVYLSLVARISPRASHLRGRLCIHQVESVIGLRRDGAVIDGIVEEIARACLLIAGAAHA
ncbi:TetR/AcrR family transcriptional regulator [Microbacterium indicum]|uniref:TetR/AcrR family transcriptional regulator n=1 Tax=Microbacterium indicum TaxID=358100 RepID=UPI00056519DC|nr:TetR/AcrR family transcriptional regulator [Microbacterium indicum]